MRAADIGNQHLTRDLVQPIGRAGIGQQTLLTPRKLRRHNDRTLLRSRVFQRAEDVGCHDSFSTNTLTLPPHARPTSQARSCVTPKSSSCGTPVSRAFIAASAT